MSVGAGAGNQLPVGLTGWGGLCQCGKRSRGLVVVPRHGSAPWPAPKAPPQGGREAVERKTQEGQSILNFGHLLGEFDST